MFRSFYRSRLALAAGSSLLALFAAPALAQTDAPLPDDAAAQADDSDIIVTSRRRAERAQDVPIALTAVSGDTLERTGATNLTQIAQLTPTLVIRNNNARNTFANIRGLGSNSDQNDGLEIGVGFYIDDVYYGRIGASQFDFIDLDRVEVLRGPQGTLFGKNTTAGAINITTRGPSFKTGFTAEASRGEDNYHQLRGSLTGPLIENFAAYRITVSDTHRDGALYNLFDGRKINDYDNFSVRGQLLLTPASNVDIRIIGDYSKQTSYSRIASVVGLFTTFANGATLTNNWLNRATRGGYTPRFNISDPFARVVDVNGPVQANMEGYGVSGKIDWNLGPVTLTSVTAWRGWDWLPDNDSDSTPLAVTLRSGTDNHQRQFSQEVRLASNGDRKIDYVAGLYYFWQNVNALGHYQQGPDSASWNNPTANRTLANYALTGFLSYSIIEPITKSYAAFGQARGKGWPIYTIIRVNNAFNIPDTNGKDRWQAYPEPQVIFEFRDGYSGDLVFAQRQGLLAGRLVRSAPAPRRGPECPGGSPRDHDLRRPACKWCQADHGERRSRSLSQSHRGHSLGTDRHGRARLRCRRIARRPTNPPIIIA